MNRRHRIYLGLIALLVVVNLGRWWLPDATEAGAAAARGASFLPQDFRLRAAPSIVRAAPLRDLFQPADGAAILATPSRPAAVAKTVSAVRAAEPAPAQVPPVPVEALVDVDVDVEVAAADAELGRLKLLGVVFHAGQGRAYLALDRENIIALAGDTVFGRFAVDKVAVDAVDLRELKTNTSRRIPVSGK
jgi:hypothetical protein